MLRSLVGSEMCIRDRGLGGGANVGFLRILRLGRAFRLVKMGRYSQGIRLVTNSMAKSMDALQLFCFILILVLVVFSAGEYYFERGTWVEAKGKYYRDNPITGEQEDTPSPFQSIPQSMWWCIVTLTTVGYGDMYPYSDLGKIFAAVTMLVGLVMLALPLSIIGTNFIEERNIMNAENEYDDKAMADPASLRVDLEYCLERAKLLQRAMTNLEAKMEQAKLLIEQVESQPASIGGCEELALKPDAMTVQSERQDSAEDFLSDTYSISHSQLTQLLKLQLEALACCLLEKDVWCEGGSGMTDMNPDIYKLLAPLVEGHVLS
eukprot:TRINITY_DN51591_c0_g1_i2.p1 TRINITY_DN51591_c0_g1~~TRINITY_DN51591_c0_g1_i2.p1  ORF type:complete len:320 (-),score=75.68 TRINITY_DN51591_c0_g1_i2:196-1155(-)